MSGSMSFCVDMHAPSSAMYCALNSQKLFASINRSVKPWNLRRKRAGETHDVALSLCSRSSTCISV
eukprot:768805-Hanusia_phi.AAC.7